MDSGTVPNPADSANKNTWDVQAFDSLRKWYLILWAQLDLLPPVGTPTRHVEQVYSFLSENRDISESILHVPTLAARKPVNRGYFPKERRVPRYITSNSSNDLDT